MSSTNLKYSVAIAGGTGDIGQSIASAFLSPAFRPQFPRVVVFTRDPSSESARSLAGRGAEIVEVKFSTDDPDDAARLKDALVNVDVVVNAIVPRRNAVQGMDILAKAVIDAGVKVYFPSEFGVDRRLNDFKGFDRLEWTIKVDHMNYVKKNLKDKNLKIILLYVGAFQDYILGKWSAYLGFDFKQRIFTILGSASTKIAITSKADIARSVAQLSVLALSQDQAVVDSIPEHVRIAGSVHSPEEIKAIAQHKGTADGDIHIHSLDLKAETEKVKQGVQSGALDEEDVVGHLRILFGEGKMDWSKENNNELINPGETLWKWTTVEDLFSESSKVDASVGSTY